MSFRKMVQMHRPMFAILVFAVLITAFHWLKPAFAYTPEGGFRPFGIGYKHKTVMSVWVVTIILAIFSYAAIIYYTG
jgi:hypothetical protein